jgi:hypothetical protein
MSVYLLFHLLKQLERNEFLKLYSAFVVYEWSFLSVMIYSVHQGCSDFQNLNRHLQILSVPEGWLEATSYQTIIWNCYVVVMSFRWGSSVCHNCSSTLFVHDPKSYKSHWPCDLYGIRIYSALHLCCDSPTIILGVHDQSEVFCDKCGLWSWGWESLVSSYRVCVSCKKSVSWRLCSSACYILNIKILSVVIFHACLVQQNVILFGIYKFFVCEYEHND